MDTPESVPGKPVDASQRANDFFQAEEGILRDIAGSSCFTFKRGDGWAINPESGEATYDPKFFEERGYTQPQALFASFHELRCHMAELSELLDLPGGAEEYEQLKAREKTVEWLYIWENCRQDLKGNRAVLEIAPSLSTSTTALYREKLFPRTDLTDKPLHLQLTYAVLRGGMAPEETLIIDDKVRQALEQLRNVKGSDVIALCTDQYQDPLTALRLSRKYVEPVIADLYKIDLSQNRGRPGQSAFKTDYEDYDSNRHPDPFGEELGEKIKKAKASASAANKHGKAYENETGVSKEDSDNYAKEYRTVAPLIMPLRNEVFRRIINERMSITTRMITGEEEGIMIDPGLMVQTYLEAKAGIDNPKTMINFEGLAVPENVPGKVQIRLVADQSGSMGEDKAIAQRRAAILCTEALKDFSVDCEEASPAIAPELQLDAETELWGFGIGSTDVGDEKKSKLNVRLYKPMSKELTEKQRIQYFKGLLETSGTTNDFDVLALIEKDVLARIAKDPAYGQQLKSGKTKEIVIVFSDGDSNNPSEVQKYAKNLRELGIKVIGLGMTQAAESIKTTYAPDGRVCYSTNDIPKVLQDMLAEILASLSIKGMPDEVMQLIKES